MMSDILTCENCGTPFEDLGPGTRCPSCNARVKRSQRAGEVRRETKPESGERSAYYFNSGTGFRAMSWQGGGRGLLLAIAAVIFAPLLGVVGLVALLIGVLFGVSSLVTVGAGCMALAGTALLLVGWKALSALRTAQRLMQGGGIRRDPFDDDRISGRWGRPDGS